MTEKDVRLLQSRLSQRYVPLLLDYVRGRSHDGPGFLVGRLDQVRDNPEAPLRFCSRHDWYAKAVFHLQAPERAHELTTLITLSETLLKETRVPRMLPVVLYGGLPDELEFMMLTLTPAPDLNPALLAGLYLPN